MINYKMSTYILTRTHGELKLVLLFTPTLEGDYLAEASTDDGATFAPPQRRTREQVEGVVSFCRTRTDTLIEETPNER